MRRQRKVKIVATLGPASNSPEMIEKLFLAGVDTFRINMSHSSHRTLGALVKAIREVEGKHGRPIGILADLQGPKLRLGEFADGEVILRAGDTFALDANPEPGSASRAHLPHPEIFTAVEPGHHLLLNDGRVRVEVVEAADERIVTRVVFGGPVSARKGVNLPDTVVPLAALTEKDRADLEAACAEEVDWIALSFVQRPQDVIEARERVAGRAGIMVKIEKPAALKVLDDIIMQCDSIMVARGDLGVELPLEEVPGAQKRLIRSARRAGKPVVVATQMLESMIEEAVPTRAEVSDVATAVFDGADAIMLSAESAVGKWPEKTVATMDRIAVTVERDPNYAELVHSYDVVSEPTSADAIAASARNMAEMLSLPSIVCYTGSGSTGLRVSRERPRVPIVALSPSTRTGRRLSLAWGLHCVLTDDPENLADMVRRACLIAAHEGFASPGDKIIITAGVPLGTPGTTNMVRIARIEDTTSQQPRLL